MGIYRKMNQAYAQRVRSVTKAITTTDLTTIGVTQAIDFAAALPSDAVVIGGDINATAKFTGGGASSCEMDLGIKTIDADGVIDGLDVFTAIVRSSLPRGVAVPTYQGGQTPQLTVTSDVNVSTLTTGAATCTIYYINIDKIADPS